MLSLLDNKHRKFSGLQVYNNQIYAAVIHFNLWCLIFCLSEFSCIHLLINHQLTQVSYEIFIFNCLNHYK